MCQVPGRITRTLYSALNFNLALENARLLFLLDDLFARGLVEMETSGRMARLHQGLHFQPVGLVGGGQWASEEEAEEAAQAEEAVRIGGEGQRCESPLASLSDPLREEPEAGGLDAAAEEVLAMLPEDDPVRKK